MATKFEQMKVCLKAARQIKKANRTKDPKEFFEAAKLLGELAHMHELIWAADAGLFAAANVYVLRLHKQLAVYEEENKKLRELYDQVHHTASVQKSPHGGH